LATWVWKPGEAGGIDQPSLRCKSKQNREGCIDEKAGARKEGAMKQNTLRNREEKRRQYSKKPGKKSEKQTKWCACPRRKSSKPFQGGAKRLE